MSINRVDMITDKGTYVKYHLKSHFVLGNLTKKNSN